MKKSLLFHVLLGIFFFLCTVVRAQDIQQAILQTRQDIQNATQQLNALRKRHTSERIAINREITELENQVIPLRKKSETLKDIAWQKETGFQQLSQEVDYLKKEVNFCASLLIEYRREMTTRMNLAEIQRLRSALRELDQVMDSGHSEKVLRKIGPFLNLIERRNRINVGGTIYPGQAVDNYGNLHSGQFVQAGPIHFFINKDKTLAGLVGLKLGSANPTLVSQVLPQSVQKLIGGEEVFIPIDVTLGEAIKVTKQKKTWIEHVRSGGIIMIPILGLGLVCLVTAVWKYVNLRQLQIEVEPVLAKILTLVNKGKIEEARIEAATLGRPVGPVLQEGIEHHNASREQIEEIMHEQILTQMPFLEKYLSLLAVSAAVAPLLGLLGTVTGMVHTFDLVAVFGTGKVNILSSGISEALVTTEYGLIVAIPTLMVHAYLSRWVKRVIHTLEQTTVAFVNGLQVRRKKK